MIDSIEMNFAYTFAGVQLGKYHQTLCCHWVSCLLQFTFDQVVSGPKDVVEEGISKALSTNVSKRYRARIAVFFFSAGHLGVQHVSLVNAQLSVAPLCCRNSAWVLAM